MHKSREAIDDQQNSLSCHHETIKCPKCGLIQTVMVKHTKPFYTCIHESHLCGYMIKATI
jgi:phage FluMu protein Com